MGIRNGVIYSVLDWNDKPKQAGLVASLLALLVTPIIFLFCWLLSLCSKCCKFDGSRRFYKEVPVNQNEEVVFNNDDFIP